MKLFHVSKHNKDLQIINMSQTHKTDKEYMGNLIMYANDFKAFKEEYMSELIQICAERKGWIKEKIATEAIFEYIRREKFNEKPSRLHSAYFTASLENAKMFNRIQRNNEAAIFYFEADMDNIFCFNMDIFDSVCKSFEKNGMHEDVFMNAKEQAIEYWNGYNKTNEINSEILYLGHPMLYRYEDNLIM